MTMMTIQPVERATPASESGPKTQSESAASSASHSFDQFMREQTPTPTRQAQHDAANAADDAPDERDSETVIALSGQQQPDVANPKSKRSSRGRPVDADNKRGQKANGRGSGTIGALDASALLVERSLTKATPPPAIDGVISQEEQQQAQTKATVKGAIDEGALKVASTRTDAALDGSVPVPEATAAVQDVTPPTVVKAPIAVEVPRAIAPAAPLTPAVVLPRAMAAVQSALAQEGVNLRVLNDGARLTLQMQDGTELAVRLMMRDGAVEVRAAGLAASLLEGRGHELKTALSNEGLKLGSFSAGQDFKERDPNGTDHEGDGPPTPTHDRASRSVTKVASRVAKRLHTGKSIVA